jgi:hypothetical protein
MRFISLVFLAAMFAGLVCAQPGGAGRGGPRPQQTPKAAAPIDLTGYWVAVVTEDWMYRMVTPPKGKYVGVPINVNGRKIADAWDPAKDEAAGEACKSYGAGGLMRVPGRLHVTWQDDNTLKIETEAGTQTRLLHFNGAPPASAEATWQGWSQANWEQAAVKAGDPKAGNLKVVTTNLRPGYLRKNGVPYSANTVINEWVDQHTGPNGDVWTIFNVEVRDPENLTQPFVTSSHFRKLTEAEGAKEWKPEACSAK